MSYVYDDEFIDKYKKIVGNFFPIQNFVFASMRAGLFKIETNKNLKHFVFILFRDMRYNKLPYASIKAMLKTIWKETLTDKFSWETVESLYEELKEADIEENIFNPDSNYSEVVFQMIGFPTNEIKVIRILKEEGKSVDNISYEFVLTNGIKFTLKKDELRQPNKFVDNWLAIKYKNPFIKIRKEYKDNFLELYFEYIKWLLETKSVEMTSEYSDRLRIIDLVTDELKRVRYAKKENAKTVSFLYDEEKIYIPKNLLLDMLKSNKIDVTSRKLFSYLKSEFNSLSNEDRVQINNRRIRYWTIGINEIFGDIKYVPKLESYDKVVDEIGDYDE